MPEVGLELAYYMGALAPCPVNVCFLYPSVVGESLELTPAEQTTLQYLPSLEQDNAVTEIRILDAGFYGSRVVWRNRATMSGYYDAAHYEKAVEDIRPFNGVSVYDKIFTMWLP